MKKLKPQEVALKKNRSIMEKLTPQDIVLLKKKGITEKIFAAQLSAFKNGFLSAALVKAATVENGGITSFSTEDVKKYARFYDESSALYSIMKFVPASGAATRMFKSLFAYYDELKAQPDAQPTGEAKVFFEHIKEFAFYNELRKHLPAKAGNLEILDTLLKNGLDYGSLPKALLLFHFNGKTPIMALEEHLMEGAEYASGGGKCKIHFTVSPEHLTTFKKKVKNVLPRYEKKYGIKYQISYSIQSPATDTVAVTLDNKIFRDEKGNIVFRPGGHGALIQNINALNTDIVFIKNIDNVTTEKKRNLTILYKKLIGGYLIAIKDTIHSFLVDINSKKFSENDLAQIETFAKKMFIDSPKEYKKYSFVQKKNYWKKMLNRPIRVCGIVKNENDIGGGPFFVNNVSNYDGLTSLQIVETSQINLKNSKQKTIFEQSTHFNPNDLACWLKDYKGQKFDLTKFTDPQAAFITEKSIKGKAIKAMELPGLWNGAMAKWITVFIETPVSVFTPVKTVTDLLKEPHR
ncbi:MAG: DUF4301 family protein [Bacteroidales bacterium]|jgi:hypothetical protein|nr:DUF4301 family protein [Bacteroidales bacterium]